MTARIARALGNGAALALTVIASLVLAACARPSQQSSTPRPDFSGLWQVAATELVIRPDVTATETDYTPQAWANLQEYRSRWDVAEQDDPARFCVRQGMPNTMTSRARDYVVDISQSADRIVVLVEFMDNFRVIHLHGKPAPATLNPSNNGYSTARFDGNDLVVETTMLKARPTIGPVQRSDQATIAERWSLRDDPVHGTVLQVDLTITDPLVFRKPMQARQVWKRAPADAALNEYACADALWDDHVAARQAGMASRGAPK